MKFTYLFLAFSLLFASCADKPAKGDSIDLVGYVLTVIPGSDIQQAFRNDQKGRLLEKGNVKNGKKHGVWVVFHKEHDFPHTIASYVEGVLNGTYFEFGPYGEIELSSNYLNGKLHGPYIKYKGFHKSEEGHYSNGQLDGLYKKYYDRIEIVQQEVSYKNGKKDGEHLFYDQQGVISMRYAYKDGEKVSGGVVPAN
jgi:antitoxin component YwqK of YwqJK toxin-antitoxin module